MIVRLLLLGIEFLRVEVLRFAHVCAPAVHDAQGDALLDEFLDEWGAGETHDFERRGSDEFAEVGEFGFHLPTPYED